MFNRVIAAAAFAALVFAPNAYAAPASKDACLKLAFDLAAKSAKKKLPEAEAVKVEGLVGKMEEECAADKFADADATSKQIDAAIGAK
ncbi:MAG: hypothetical protein ACT4OU_02805 [Hyphomicrobium sp.]